MDGHHEHAVRVRRIPATSQRSLQHHDWVAMRLLDALEPADFADDVQVNADGMRRFTAVLAAILGRLVVRPPRPVVAVAAPAPGRSVSMQWPPTPQPPCGSGFRLTIPTGGGYNIEGRQ